jgi:hypothetical protein
MVIDNGKAGDSKFDDGKAHDQKCGEQKLVIK